MYRADEVSVHKLFYFSKINKQTNKQQRYLSKTNFENA